MRQDDCNFLYIPPLEVIAQRQASSRSKRRKCLKSIITRKSRFETHLRIVIIYALKYEFEPITTLSVQQLIAIYREFRDARQLDRDNTAVVVLSKVAVVLSKFKYLFSAYLRDDTEQMMRYLAIFSY